MASEAEALHEDEYEEEPTMDELLTERLEEAQALHMGTADQEQESVDVTADDDADTTTTDVREERGCEPSVFESDEVDAEVQQLCWNTARSSTATLMEESAQHTQQQQLQQEQLPRKQNDEPTRRRKLTNSKEQQQIQSLTRKLGQYQKLNAELHHQLQVFYKNEAVAQLENRNKEKQLQIDQLQCENRILLHQQRLLTKQVEELQESKDNFPLKKYALQEELRIGKERLRQYKEKQKEVDEKSFKMHQQAVDLATKNKTLVEKLKTLEAAAATATALARSASAACIPAPPPSTLSYTTVSSSPMDAESIIASQEDEITRLQQRVTLMKKTQRPDKLKQERQLKVSQEEVEQSRTQLKTFYQQLSAKEKTIRSLFLQMKKLKRVVQDLTNAQQTNQHMQQMVFGREVRFSQNHSPQNYSPRNHNNHSHHHVSQQQLGHSSHATSALTQNLLLSFPAVSKKVATDQIHDTLRQLGYIPSFASSRKLSVMPKRKFKGSQAEGSRGVKGIGYKEEDEDEDEEELPPNCVQGKLISCPPPSSTDRKVVRNGTPTSRSQFYTALSPPSRESSSRQSSLKIALDNERDRVDNKQAGDDTRDDAFADFGIRASEKSDMEGETEGDKEDKEKVDPGEEVQRKKIAAYGIAKQTACCGSLCLNHLIWFAAADRPSSSSSSSETRKAQKKKRRAPFEHLSSLLNRRREEWRTKQTKIWNHPSPARAKIQIKPVQSTTRRAHLQEAGELRFDGDGGSRIADLPPKFFRALSRFSTQDAPANNIAVEKEIAGLSRKVISFEKIRLQAQVAHQLQPPTNNSLSVFSQSHTREHLNMTELQQQQQQSDAFASPKAEQRQQTSFACAGPEATAAARVKRLHQKLTLRLLVSVYLNAQPFEKPDRPPALTGISRSACAATRTAKPPLAQIAFCCDPAAPAVKRKENSKEEPFAALVLLLLSETEDTCNKNSKKIYLLPMSVYISLYLSHYKAN